MAISKQKKQTIVEKLREILKSANSLVFVNFHGLKVGDTTAMRKALREKGVGYMVSKKTLITRALADSPVLGEMPGLAGEIAIAYGEDQLAPAREVYAAVKKHKDNLAIVGGIFEKQYADKERMLSLALIPPRETLYAQFVNLLASPMQRLVVGLSQIAAAKTAK